MNGFFSSLFKPFRYLREHGVRAFAVKVRDTVNGTRSVSGSKAPSIPSPHGTESLAPYQDVYKSLFEAASSWQDPSYLPISAPGRPPQDPPVKLISFYLPQFHPIPENDEWWGKGFTEWTNVSKAIPQFIGHYQPHLPGELGFYDLRIPDVLRRQVELARQYGIFGFAFYYYWFDGKRLLEKPIERLYADQALDFPYCIIWANENWTRRWDGKEHDVLIAQKHSAENDFNFIKDIAPFFHDKRYIRIDGKPVIMVYRVQLLPEPSETADRWRSYCRELGIGEIYLMAGQVYGFEDPRETGFDAAFEFPPHNIPLHEINNSLAIVNPSYEGHVFRYQDLADYFSHRPIDTPYELYKTVCPGWDNEPRKPGRGSSFAFSTPDLYGKWLANVCRATLRKDLGKRMVFINAWNEWGEGAHLEPDRRYGYAYLERTARSLYPLAKPSAAARESDGSGAGRTSVRLDASALKNVSDSPEGMNNHRQLFAGLDDNQWFSLHTEGYRRDPALREILPSLPDEELQLQTVGASGDDALRQGMAISRIVKSTFEKHMGDFSACANVLEFGCSWGQVIRFLLKDIDPSRLWGIDPYDKAIDFCKQSNPWSHFHRNDPFPPTPFRSEMFDLVFSYSAFSHLSEDAQLKWIDELSRIIRPGGLLIVTTWGRDLLTGLQNPQNGGEIPSWQRNFPSLFPDIAQTLAAYDDGRFCFGTSRTVYGDNAEWYGEACIPEKYVKENWSKHFDLVDYTRLGTAGQQNIIVAKRNSLESVDPGPQTPSPGVMYLAPEISGPILVYTSSKVGSTSVLKSLLKLKLNAPVYHTHLLNNLSQIEDDLKTRHAPKDSLASVQMGRVIRAEFDAHPDLVWNIISMTRDPIARNISLFFQNIQEFLPDVETRIKNGSITAADLRDLFLFRINHFGGGGWFDSQLKPVFSIDVYREPFDKERGYQIYQKGRFRLLLMRMEDLDQIIQPAMKDFLGIDGFPLLRANVGSEKYYAELYKEFKRIPFPSIYVHEIYSTPGAKHFYTDEELKRFADRWTKPKA